MTKSLDRQSTPIWRCPQDICGEQWATWEEATTCPYCHRGLGQRTGFTYGEVAEAAEKFGFSGDLPVHISEPVPDLVQLTTLTSETWIGLPVFHPCGQEENRANWLLYDVGVVVEVFPHPSVPNELQCRFIVAASPSSFTLEYGPSNLWVPRVLAERLK